MSRAAGWPRHPGGPPSPGGRCEVPRDDLEQPRVTAAWAGISDPDRAAGLRAYAELVEAGFFVVDCESPDRAVEIGARIPEAAYGLVEVRPILRYGSADL